MRWLHFSDFHLGGQASPQHEALSSLVDYIRTFNESEIDAIFLAGDIAYSGQQAEYDRFEKHFLQPLLNIPFLRGVKIFAVPGNHDVDCDATSPVTWEGIRSRNQKVYFAEDIEGIQVRRHRAGIFKNYHDFVVRNGILSPNPFEEVSHLFGKETGFPVDILAVNTSFFSDREEKSNDAITPCPLSSFRSRLAGERARPLIAIGHHPHGCFLPEQQKPFETLLLEKKAVYLHGHEHNPKMSANVDGTIRTIGFGATYISSLGTPAHAPYRNSFTRCSLTDHLELNGYSWDCEVGRWEDTTRTQFSGGITETTYNGSSIVLTVPLLLQPRTVPKQPSALAQIARRAPEPQTVGLVSAPSDSVWLRLLLLSKSINENYRFNRDPTLQSRDEVDGKIELVVDDGDKRDLIICIPGASHILSAKEVESYNTRLDTEDYRSVSVLSFGKISDEARQMYLRLRTRKPIEVLTNKEFALRWRELASTRQVDTLAQTDAAGANADLLIDEDQVHLLIASSVPFPSFKIVDPAGDVLPVSHQVVLALRANNALFHRMPYEHELLTDPPLLPLQPFDESRYLAQCYKENNVMKYAALANVGIRFSDFSLEDLYIDASACEVDASKADRFNAPLDDHLAAYPASDKLKAHIKRQYLSDEDEAGRHETSQALEYCQKFGAVLLTGDPGSGKTCFVKSEILAYSKRGVTCDGDQSKQSWHSLHIPVMIQLSQAAAEGDLHSKGMLFIAARLLQRRGYEISSEALKELLQQGRLALFFDGLDEVVSVEKRALVVQHINDLVTESLPLGNRVVVTSRPAAVNVVNLLPTLHRLELQGLTEEEIRLLARRILTLKLSETNEGVVLDITQSRADDGMIVRQLLEDCRDKPGIARLAKNPLLLTLLVMVYANSGAPSAKRHRIYEEAIKTLASVRGRQSGHDPVSAQDLRERLGAVALSVYRKESGFLPTRAEVTEVVRTVMTRQRGDDVTSVEADRFIQRVAESTGLIAVANDDGKSDQAAVVTFMHHSFMEYFAAIGLSRELDHLNLMSLVTQPRWIEILTLLAGIIGESEDIAPVLARCIGDGSGFGEVDAKYLIFSMDCALECDVPSEAAIRLLSASIAGCVETGPGRRDPWVRSEIGQRLSQLIDACGIAPFEAVMVRLIRSSEPEVCSAGISLSAYACTEGPESADILRMVEEGSARTDEQTQCSVCEAAAKVPWLRSQVILQSISRCFKRSTRCKRAAFEAVLAIPGLAVEHWPAIISGLDETHVSVRRLASKAAIKAGIDGDLAALNDAKKDVVVNAFQYIYDSSLDSEYAGSRIRQETVNRLMTSGLLRDRLLAIQLLPAVENTVDHGYHELLGILTSSQDHREIASALRALRSSRDAQVHVTVNDIKIIRKLFEGGTADVRRAAIQVLGSFPADNNAVRSVLEKDLREVDSSEFGEIVAVLGRAQTLKDDVREFLARELEHRFGSRSRRRESHYEEVRSLLSAAETLAKDMPASVTASIRSLVRDYKVPEDVRRAALRAYPAVAIPTPQVVGFLTTQFEMPGMQMTMELVQTPAIFARNCRQNVDYVIACVEAMSGLRDAAIALYRQLSKRPISSSTEYMISALRDGVTEISRIIVTFEEFIGPPHR